MASRLFRPEGADEPQGAGGSPQPQSRAPQQSEHFGDAKLSGIPRAEGETPDISTFRRAQTIGRLLGEPSLLWRDKAARIAETLRESEGSDLKALLYTSLGKQTVRARLIEHLQESLVRLEHPGRDIPPIVDLTNEIARLGTEEGQKIRNYVFRDRAESIAANIVRAALLPDADAVSALFSAAVLVPGVQGQLQQQATRAAERIALDELGQADKREQAIDKLVILGKFKANFREIFGGIDARVAREALLESAISAEGVWLGKIPNGELSSFVHTLLTPEAFTYSLRNQDSQLRTAQFLASQLSTDTPEIIAALSDAALHGQDKLAVQAAESILKLKDRFGDPAEAAINLIYEMRNQVEARDEGESSPRVRAGIAHTLRVLSKKPEFAWMAKNEGVRATLEELVRHDRSRDATYARQQFGHIKNGALGRLKDLAQVCAALVRPSEAVGLFYELFQTKDRNK